MHGNFVMPAQVADKLIQAVQKLRKFYIGSHSRGFFFVKRVLTLKPRPGHPVKTLSFINLNLNETLVRTPGAGTYLNFFYEENSNLKKINTGPEVGTIPHIRLKNYVLGLVEIYYFSTLLKQAQRWQP